MGLDISHLKPIPPHKASVSAEFLTLEELDVVPGYVDRHRPYVGNKEELEGRYVQGIYFEEVGYQRKGMSNAFYKQFPPDYLSDDKLIFEKLYDMVSGDHIDDLAIRQSEFRSGFLNNFVQGESLVMLSR